MQVARMSKVVHGLPAITESLLLRKFIIVVGKLQSTPPPWISIGPPCPMVCSIMAEHSMCQPGLPAPHGLSQVGSPGLDAFQSAKSRSSLLVNVVEANFPSAINPWFPMFSGHSLP